MTETEPEAPQGVRLVLLDSTEVAVDVLHTGYDAGSAVWEVITDVDRSQVAGLLVALFPPHCSIVFPLSRGAR